MVEVLMLYLEELLPLLPQDHVLSRPLRGCLDVMDHTLTTGQLAMFLQRLHADNNTIWMI